jgi:oligopeptide/dipeptide ABC transporter ATP-binding protein
MISEAASTSQILQVSDLRVTYGTTRGSVRAVRGLDLTVDAGGVVGLGGESGSGKTTAALAIAGLLPRKTAITGSIQLEQRQLVGLSDKAWTDIRGTRIGYVFQDPLSYLNPVVSVGSQISESLLRHRMVASKAAARDEAVRLLGLVHMPDPARRIDAYPHELSGGQRQRAMIAMALACRPRLLIADEPTTALDVTVQSQILRLLAELRRELSMSILIITHNLGVIAGLTDRVSVMYAGRVVESGSTEDVLLRPRHPYTRALLESVPRVDRPRGERLPVISGSPPDPIADVIGCPFRPRCPSAIQRCSETDPLLEHMGGSTSVACWNPGQPT